MIHSKPSGPSSAATPEQLNAQFRTELLEWGLRYIKFNLHFLPLHDKLPLRYFKCKKWRYEAPSQDQVMEWARNRWVNGWGILAGVPPLFLCATDFDTKEGLAGWAQDHPGLEKALPSYVTYRGGHVLYRSRVPGHFSEEGVGDLIGNPLHYFAAPPSYHQKGCLYRWRDGRVLTSIETLPWFNTPEELLTAGLIPGDKIGEIYEYLRPYPRPKMVPYSPTFDRSTLYSSPDVSPPPLESLLPKPFGGTGLGKEGGHIPYPIPGGNPSPSTNGYTPFTTPDTQKICNTGLRRYKELMKRVDGLVGRVMPTGVGMRHGCIGALVRGLKALGVPDELLVRSFDRWWARACDVVGTKEREVSLKDFWDLWSGCVVLGPTPAARTAPNAPLLTGPAAFLFRLCVALASQSKGGVFFLSYEKAGELLGQSKSQGKLLVKKLTSGGYLERVTQGDRSTGLASEYRLAARTPTLDSD